MPPDPSLEEFWRELGRRADLIHAAYTRARVQLNENGALGKAIAEAKELADGVKSKEPTNDQAVLRMVEAAQVVYTVAESIETCQSGGLDITRHLAQMSTGTIDFGTPVRANRKHFSQGF